VWADSLAKHELHRIASLTSPPLRCHMLLGERWSAFIASEKIVSDPRIPVLEAIGTNLAKTYWIQRGQLTDHSFSLVSWDVLDRAVRSYPHTFQMWLSKFASGHSAVGVTMLRWKKWDSARCPVCSTHDESVLHVLCCSHPSRLQAWSLQMDAFRLWLTQANTAPDIVHCLLSTLGFRGTSSFAAHASFSILQAAKAQDQIGFFGLMVGRLATAWIPLQEAYYCSIHSQRSAILWAVRVCHQLLQVTHAIWLVRNASVLEARQAHEAQLVLQAVMEQFQFGLLNLLPVDRFYVTPGPLGFSQDRVLSLPLDDQQLWLQAVRNARLRGQEQLLTPLGRMQQTMDEFLHPLAS